MAQGYSISDFFGEIISDLRQRTGEVLEDAALKEEVVCIDKATRALVEAKVSDDEIIRLLQKYWDLRASEAHRFLQQATDYKG